MCRAVLLKTLYIMYFKSAACVVERDRTVEQLIVFEISLWSIVEI
jgi:hypothetical protein